MRSWIILSNEEAEEQFWSNINFPLNAWGDSAYEVRIGHRGKCRHDWDRFIEKSGFQIFYNPYKNMYRVYLSCGVPKWIKIYDPDPFIVKSLEFIERIDKYLIDGRDFTDKFYVW